MQSKKISSEQPGKRRLGRPPTKENPRASIISAAAVLFAEHGYETSSLGDLAMAMKMSKASIYHYFATKQEIYDAIILRTLEGLLAKVSTAVNLHDEAPDRLRVFMISHARYFEEHWAGFVVMLVGFSGMRNSEFLGEAVSLRDEYEALLRSIIEQGIEGGTLRSVNVITTTRAVLSLLNWMVRWFKPNAGMNAEQIALDYYELMINGLLPQR